MDAFQAACKSPSSDSAIWDRLLALLGVAFAVLFGFFAALEWDQSKLGVEQAIVQNQLSLAEVFA